MRKKWRVFVIIAFIPIVALNLSACLGGEQGNHPAKTTILMMATGGTGGTYYPFGSILARTIEESTGYLQINVNATGASAENIRQIGKNLADLAIVQNDVMDYAYNGTNTWTGNTVKEMSALMSLYPEICQVIVAADSDINSIEDLAGRRVATGDVGSGVEANATQILEIHGLSVSDIEQAHMGFTSSVDAMKHGAIDAFFMTSGVPNTVITDLQVMQDIRLINISRDKIDALIAKYPFYAKETLTREDYAFLETPVETVAVKAILIASPNIDQQIAYDVVKAILESQDDIASAHAKGVYLSTEGAIEGISIEIHPGAVRYFKESGVFQ